MKDLPEIEVVHRYGGLTGAAAARRIIRDRNLAIDEALELVRHAGAKSVAALNTAPPAVVYYACRLLSGQAPPP